MHHNDDLSMLIEKANENGDVSFKEIATTLDNPHVDIAAALWRDHGAVRMRILKGVPLLQALIHANKAAQMSVAAFWVRDDDEALALASCVMEEPA
jgi:hypothetical protein